MKHLLSIESLSREEIYEILDLAVTMKSSRGRHEAHPLRHQCWGILFSKSSTRTRISFEVGIRELGGDAIFMSSQEMQLGRGEPIKDTARVMGRMLHGAVIRTYAQQDVVEFAEHSGIPTINALTDGEHPCQILADLFTLRELGLNIEKMRVCFVGDGACNVPISWIWAAARLGFELRIAAPSQFQPDPAILEAAGGNVHISDNLDEAADDADILYTDVWVSMGKEEESAYRIAQLAGFQLTTDLVARVPDRVVMHCLPAYRGKEITDEVLEAHASTIFLQAENRLHAQKAILSLLCQPKA